MCDCAAQSRRVSFCGRPLDVLGCAPFKFFHISIFFPHTTCLFSRSLGATFRSVRLPFRALNGNVAALSTAILPRFARLSCRALKGSFFGHCRFFGSLSFRLDMNCHHVGNCRLFGSPYFRLHLICPLFGNCRRFGPPYFRLDMNCHHVGNCRHFGPLYSRLDMKCYLFGHRRHFGPPYFRLDL